MTVQEIFDTPAIKKVENEMIGLEENIERHRVDKPNGLEMMRVLIGLRRNLLADMFVMDENYKRLLSDFNETMKQQLIRMRHETIKAAHGVMNADVTGEIQAIGKCFLGYRYSRLHPVQTMRAKKIWAILNCSIDDYVQFYSDGVLMGGYVYDSRKEQESENQMFYLQEEPDNWNEGLDMEITKDMYLIYPVHHLVSHTDFSIFDLLWVRDFNMEIQIESDYATYPEEEEGEDISFICK
jgi:hypothetical protein